jgi:tripartite-type tricarboxylate transporter receptor subunit TctC
MRRAVSLWLLCGLFTFAADAPAQAWPSKTIRVVNPFAAGGFGEVIVRPMMERLSKVLGQSIVVESVAGANGTIASNQVARSAPDGHTLLLANLGPQVISPILQSDLPYDPVKDFEPITQIVSSPLVLLVRADFPAATLPALIAHAKANPGKLAYASVGPASTTHLAAALLNLRAGTEMIHVPYKGATPAIADLAGGQVQLAFINISLARPQIDGGRMRGLGVTTLKRSGAMPEMPAVAETLPGFEVNTWFGFMAPTGTPKWIVARLQSEIASILKSPDFAARLVQNGLDAEGSSPEEFAARIRADLAQWREIARATGIKSN